MVPGGASRTLGNGKREDKYPHRRYTSLPVDVLLRFELRVPTHQKYTPEGARLPSPRRPSQVSVLNASRGPDLGHDRAARPCVSKSWTLIKASLGTGIRSVATPRAGWGATCTRYQSVPSHASYDGARCSHIDVVRIPQIWSVCPRNVDIPVIVGDDAQSMVGENIDGCGSKLTRTGAGHERPSRHKQFLIRRILSPKTSAYFRRRSGTVIRFSAVISFPMFSAMLVLLS